MPSDKQNRRSFDRNQNLNGKKIKNPQKHGGTSITVNCDQPYKKRLSKQRDEWQNDKYKKLKVLSLPAFEKHWIPTALVEELQLWKHYFIWKAKNIWILCGDKKAQKKIKTVWFRAEGEFNGSSHTTSTMPFNIRTTSSRTKNTSSATRMCRPATRSVFFLEAARFSISNWEVAARFGGPRAEYLSRDLPWGHTARSLAMVWAIL